MNRCSDCNTLMTREERICPECGTVLVADTKNIGSLLYRAVQFMFYCSLVYLVAGLLFIEGASFRVSLLFTVALLILMRSASDQAPQQVKKR